MKQYIHDSKLRSPDSKHLVKRTRLLELAQSNIDASIVSIKADCGYGKTSLMSQLHDIYTGPCIWYQLDERDSEIAFFLAHLSEGVRKVIPDVDNCIGTPGNEAFSSRTEAQKWLLSLVNCIESLEGIEPAFFFDDLHYINSFEDIISLVGFLIAHPPEGSRFFLASREKTKIHLGRLRAHKSVIDITTEDLAFQEDETKSLISTLTSIDPMDDVVSKLTQVTEGWPVALILSSGLINKKRCRPDELFPSTMVSTSAVSDYLTEELWNDLEENMQNLFMAASLLSSIQIDILDRIFEDDDSLVPSGRLFQIATERQQMTACIEYNREYRFHAIFKRFLQMKVQEKLSKQEIASLHHKFARAYEHDGNEEQAIECFFKAGRNEEAARILSRYGDRVFQSGRLKTLSAWLSNISEGIKEIHPSLILLEAQILDSDAKVYQGLQKIEEARLIFESSSDDSALCECYFLQGGIFLTSNDLDNAIIAAESAVQHAVDKEQKIKTLSRLAVIHLIQGDASGAMINWERATRLASTSASSLRRSISITMLAGKYYQGDFKSVVEDTRREFESDTRPGTLRERFIIVYWRIYALIKIGAYDDASRVLDEVKEFLGDELGEIQSSSLSLIKGLSMIYSGEPDKGYRLIEPIAGSLTAATTAGPECGYNYLGAFKRRHKQYAEAISLHELALVQLEKEKSRKLVLASTLVNLGACWLRMGEDYQNKGLSYLNEAEALARECGYKYILSQVFFYRAWLALKTGNREEARKKISLSLDLASKYWHNHFFAQEGTISQDLLVFAFENNIERDYLIKIFSLIGSEILPSLTPLLKSEVTRTKKEAMNAVASAGGVLAAPLIYHLLKDDDIEVREFAKKVAIQLREEIDDPNEVLTKREGEVLKYLSEGISNAEIAELLCISEPTVKSHVTRIFQKLGVTKRTQAAYIYHQRTGNAK